MTTGDNRTVDFSSSLIFMTSNLGAPETNKILDPAWGFSSTVGSRPRGSWLTDRKLNDKLIRASVEAARRKFSPEFMNRIDKCIVFKPLTEESLRQVLTLELNLVQKRIFNSTHGATFVFVLTDAAKDFLLAEGTDLKYGARHLKRVIDRHLVHPLSNLIGSGQIAAGDLIEVDLDQERSRLTFVRAADSLPAGAMAEMVDSSVAQHLAHSVGAAGGQRSVNVRSIRQ
jgi:ATP-dependent Clp protease ATP-binding subunit ClpA